MVEGLELMLSRKMGNMYSISILFFFLKQDSNKLKNLEKYLPLEGMRMREKNNSLFNDSSAVLILLLNFGIIRFLCIIMLYNFHIYRIHFITCIKNSFLGYNLLSFLPFLN